PAAQDAENAFYEALERCDLDGMMAVWAEDEDIVCIHPTGPRLTGQDEVRRGWARIFAGGPGARVQTSLQVAISGMMLAVHSVHENFTVEGDPRPRAPAGAVPRPRRLLRQPLCARARRARALERLAAGDAALARLLRRAESQAAGLSLRRQRGSGLDLEEILFTGSRCRYFPGRQC